MKKNCEEEESAMKTPVTFFTIQHLLLLLITVNLSSLLVANELGSSFPGCPERCGDIGISYPFGIGDDRCFFPGFEVTCNQSIPFLTGSNLQLVEIFQGEVRVTSNTFIATACYPYTYEGTTQEIALPPESPFTFSINSNRFVVVGCNAMGMITDSSDWINTCNTICHTSEIMDSDSCTGEGCCQTPLPPLKNQSLTIFTNSFDKNSKIVTPCVYGFVVEEGRYSNAWGLNQTANITVKLEWTIGERHCNEARDGNVSICGEYSYCDDSDGHSGYLCKCILGFEGNPYLNGSQGCQAVNGCHNTTSDPCVPEATCLDTNPGHICTCPEGTVGDGFKRGNGCRKRFQVIYLVLATMLSIVLIISCFSWIYWTQKKRHLAKIRMEYFRKNGGLLLQQHFSSSKGTTTKHIKIFSAQELEKVTDNYDGSRVLGYGGQGTVYKGILNDGSAVAIKKSQSVAECQVNQFINELVILSQINHRNIVKLIGCCLETQVPMLVYEFIPGGTLYQKIHGDLDHSIQLWWKDRLRVAIEVGEALSYLHSYASMPIFHRDIKSSNVLLDENNTAKLADFGVSRLVPLDKNQVSTVVQGTIGYLDPEYFNTGKLTEKSDVYSFGVVLLELLTGRKAVRHEESRDYSSLVIHFQSYIGNENLLEILDERILEERKMEEVKAVAGIASRCLKVFGAERPTMKKVAQELVSIASKTPGSPLSSSMLQSSNSNPLINPSIV